VAPVAAVLRALGTPAHVYYKYEGVSPAGSHKPNTAVPQAYANTTRPILSLGAICSAY
jgi:tryptophan synthase beta chain